jgi:formate hydrogenlyase subunit 4
MLERIVFNLLQVFVVLAFAPLVEGVATRLKENLQSKRGPSIFQPYRDIWKLLHKDEIVSDRSSWIFRAAPYVAFTAPVFVALLIPVLTRYPLFFAFMGDMLGAASCWRSAASSVRSPRSTRPIRTARWGRAEPAWSDSSPSPCLSSCS